MIVLDRESVAHLYDGETDAVSPDYGRLYGSRKRILAGLFAALICLVLVLPFFGSVDIPFMTVLEKIFTLDMDSREGKIVWNIRMVRIIGGILAGAGLAVCGTVMQCILRNPLASPYTLGISSAAAYGASFAIIFVGSGSAATSTVFVDNPYTTVLFAFIFSLVATGIVVLLTRVTRVSAETMVLAGIAVSAVFSALLSFNQYIATDSQLGNIVSWMFGDVGKATWSWNLFILAALAPVTLYFLYRRWDYNAIESGEDTAMSLGVNTSKERLVGLVLSSLLCSVIVSFFGIIAFIGLLGPHIARMLIGSDHRYLIPASMAVGAIVILLSDQIGLHILSDGVIPVGIITSMIGGPMFVYLLIRRYRA